MLRLKGLTQSGEWVEFNISQVYDVCLYDNRWYIKGYPNDYVIDSATIQLATPDLLACLKMALVNIEANGFGMPRVQEKIRQVIRQVEGRTEDSI